MSACVFVTGGSGFVGSAVIDELLRRGHAVVALADRRAVDDRGGAVRVVRGDLFDARALDEGAAGCEAVVHLVGIIMERRAAGITFGRIHVEGTRGVVDAAVRNGVRRYVHMSALGARPNAASDYHKTKFQGEQCVQASGLDWTIFRPSLIHGLRGDFMRMEAMWARRKAPPPMFFMPFMPYFGGKKAGKLQPVFVEDVARAFADAMSNPRTIREIYPLGGADRLTWPQLHDAVARAVVGKERMTASMPVPVAKLLAWLGLGRLLGFNRDQVIMSQEDNIADLSKFISHFGWEPRKFEKTLRLYAKQL